MKKINLLKYLIFILYLFFSSIELFSQRSNIYVLNQFNKFETSVVDSGLIRIYYAFNAVDINDSKTYDDIQRLDIGLKLSKYYSYFIFASDSLFRDFSKKHPNSKSAPLLPGEWGKQGKYWTLVIWSDYFKEFSKNSLTEYALMPMGFYQYQYSETLPVQEWKLFDDTTTIAGYPCQKVTCRFRGRDFIAWFTPDIPISNGPWKFGCLPGLILKVYDVDKFYEFECIKIEFHNKKFPIIMYDSKKYQKIERIKLMKLHKDIYNDYFKTAGVTMNNNDGSPSYFVSKPYNPIELE